MTRVSRLFICCSLAVSALVAAIPAAAQTPGELILQAEAVYPTRYVQETMIELVALYESVLPDLDSLSTQSQAFVLNRLSQLDYELAMFTVGDVPEDEALFAAGKEYGLQSLRLNPEYAARESRGLENALTYVTDVAALHWTANNWGKWCGMHPFEALAGQQSWVLALFERSVELDPTYWGASSASALGSLLVMSPGLLGGDVDRGLALIEQSIAADPTYLNNRIILAEYWGFTYNMWGKMTGIRDAELIERECSLILESEIGPWPFWNRMAQADVDRLLELLDEHSE